MANIFLISDTHFGHEKAWKVFKREDDTPLRPFTSTEEMDNTMIKNWNSVVRPQDKVYHIGDLAFGTATRLIEVFEQLNGTKVLIKGNHDNDYKLSVLQKVFKDIRAYHALDKHLLAHIPVHPESKARWKAQIHGHIHHRVMNDPWYINVSVENINYTPVPFESIRIK